MNTYPIFRLALFLAAGIFFAETFRVEAGNIPVYLMLCLLVVLGLLVRNSSYTFRWLFGGGVACFMFLTGVLLTDIAWRKVKVEWPSEKRVYKGVVQEMILEKKQSYQCRVRVVDKDIWLVLPKDSSSRSLRIADELYFYARVESPRNRGEAQAFDYATYLYRKGICGTAYVPAKAWERKGSSDDKTLKQKALLVREHLIGKYREWGIGERQMPVLSALTLGYKGDLDKSTRETYSTAGISHVLALSGMHIGIVWMLLDLMLGLLMGRRYKVLRCMVVVLTLWTFAFLVGLEASVVRAVVMCMLMELGRLSDSKVLSMNTLAVAAMFMLLYNPFYLFDVGFQLSFVAVLSILIFYPIFFRCIPVKNRWMRWLWGTGAVSVSAQLGTAPLVMYYFSGFSVYFLLTNLVAAILVPFIIYAAFLLLVVSPLDGFRLFVVNVLNCLVDALNGVAGWVSRLPYARFSYPMLRPLEIVLFYVVLACGMMLWKTGKRLWLIRTLASLACLLALHLYVLCSA